MARLGFVAETLEFYGALKMNKNVVGADTNGVLWMLEMNV